MRAAVAVTPPHERVSIAPRERLGVPPGDQSKSFNPRSRVGRLVIHRVRRRVSIHAPAWGATGDVQLPTPRFNRSREGISGGLRQDGESLGVSIHAHVRATRTDKTFQERVSITLPRGGDVGSAHDGRISFHPRSAWGRPCPLPIRRRFNPRSRVGSDSRGLRRAVHQHYGTRNREPPKLTSQKCTHIFPKPT